MNWSDKITVTNEDNMQLMARYPDNYFDLAIVDPPYGMKTSQEYGNTRGLPKKYTKKQWDNSIPNKEYFIELKRVSKNQIVWGGNFMTDNLQVSRGWIYWRKLMGGNYSDGELAWTSFDTTLKEFTKRSDQRNRFHPTQKPVALYKWLLDKYAKPTDKILDTHLGSGSIAIACHDYGFELTACELDEEYYEAAKKRFLNHSAQTKLFTV
jgi:site-specific DNA-methyltransferase (adenine-specific)